MANWFRRFDDFLSQQPATNDDVVKPVQYDWSARAEEVKAFYDDRAKETLKAYKKKSDDAFEIVTGKHSLVISMKDYALQIPFPVENSVRLIKGRPARLIKEVVYFDEDDHFLSTPYGFSRDRYEHSVYVHKAYPSDPDTVSCNGVDYPLPHGKGQRVYDLLLANMIENA